MVNNTKELLKSLSFHILSGLSVAFLSSLLIYFKQKEFLHLGVVLFSIFVIYFLSYHFSKRTIQISIFIKLISLIVILLTSWLGPQFIYQIRPYTFYISGLAMGSMVLIAISTNLVLVDHSNNSQWSYGVFLISFVAGYLIPWEYLQYLIFGISLFVLSLLFVQFKFSAKIIVTLSFLIIGMCYWYLSKPILFHEEQANYEDKLLFTADTQFHNIAITQWHKDHWIFMDKLKNISSIDEYLFYEPMAHSVFKIGVDIQQVLIIGGENGCLIREVLKHEEVTKIDVVSYDTLLRNLGQRMRIFTEMNNDAYLHDKVDVIHEDLIEFVTDSTHKYDAIFIDLPDPKSIEANQYYTVEFYKLLIKLIDGDGLMITQAGSPYFATKAYTSIGLTIRNVGFHTLPIHNQILTLGEWGWYIGSTTLAQNEMKRRLVDREIHEFDTKWFNQEASKLVSSFGKTSNDTMNVGINTLENPLVYQYYLKGNWNLN